MVNGHVLPCDAKQERLSSSLINVARTTTTTTSSLSKFAAKKSNLTPQSKRNLPATTASTIAVDGRTAMLLARRRFS
jgi:hypothetical protein